VEKPFVFGDFFFLRCLSSGDAAYGDAAVFVHVCMCVCVCVCVCVYVCVFMYVWMLLLAMLLFLLGDSALVLHNAVFYFYFYFLFFFIIFLPRACLIYCTHTSSFLSPLFPLSALSLLCLQTYILNYIGLVALEGLLVLSFPFYPF
jgi:hypothetical protein